MVFILICSGLLFFTATFWLGSYFVTTPWLDSSDTYEENLSENQIKLDKASYKTSVENISFNYFPKEKKLKYIGTVGGGNGCVFVDKTFIKQESNQKIILEVFLSENGLVCTQNITKLKIEEEVYLELKPDQIEIYQDLFEIKVFCLQSYLRQLILMV